MTLALKVFENIEKCKDCNLCVKECTFLKENGAPGKIGKLYSENRDESFRLSFLCSLCSLCDTICPFGVEPSKMFLAIREDAVKDGFDLSKYKRIENYEERGRSDRYSLYIIPDGCDTVFFPGCTLTGTRSETTEKIYRMLGSIDGKTGIVLDCCIKPSHDLGKKEFFKSEFFKLSKKLKDNGIKKIITACPNCTKVFREYGKDFEIVTVYEIFSDSEFDTSTDKTVTVHDSCVMRNNKNVQDSVRKILSKKGADIIEMPHNRENTICCGEGGSVGFVKPFYAKKWKEKRQSEAKKHKTVTYCAGCSSMLSGIDTVHILDIIAEPEKSFENANVTKAPFTYLKRLSLKRRLMKKNKEHIEKKGDKTSFFKKNFSKLALFLILTAAIVGIRVSGLTDFLDQEKLRGIVTYYGPVAPAVYMLIYLAAPALFLPGLPITVVGGILFGPFWGTLYSIISATAGAGIAFLISRYISGDIVRSRFEDSKLSGLYKSVEKNGWKIVAITRLVPLFPFNLLNYAFGLTSIKFSHYMITSFICMLPGCIAIIVFSSSLLDLLKGKITAEFIAGFCLMALVSSAPFIYKRIKDKKGSRLI